MKRSLAEITARMTALCEHMAKGGKVTVTDKADNTVKESRIFGIYSNCKVALSDCIYSEYGIFDVSIILNHK